MSIARNLILALLAALGLLNFTLGWLDYTPGDWLDRDMALCGLVVFAGCCGLAWRYRS